MATKKTKKADSEPIVTIGSHSVRTQYPDGRVEFVVDDDKLRADVIEALSMVADITQEKPKAKKTKAKSK
ncbi:hypothetical protein UFOVP112_29 [uncultured Caudovirales phage]|uniref:Uncharacterized protein n=1 Tax=uncultured Caudovirales phage TaxID=2100421 RepID=A0A6J5L148_9CAUD|nr:hypothetical protein UFOVP112_29 [uncultured Caudovirales phage]